MKYELKVAWCPYCDQGWVEIVKSIKSGKLCLVCSECDTVWSKPEDIPLNRPAIDQEIGRVEVPTLEVIKAAGWNKNIMKDDNAQLTVFTHLNDPVFGLLYLFLESKYAVTYFLIS